MTERSFTLVSFHAHPDDEALLTAGTLARAAAEGHRVVLVVATAGEAGLSAAADTGRLGELRHAELQRSAQALGCQRVVVLGYPDSGMNGEHEGFAALAASGPARRLAEILREEAADVLTTYDPGGGYGHPDHIQVHRVGKLAALFAGTPVVLEATVNRGPLVRAATLVHWTGWAPVDFSPAKMSAAYSDSRDITHRVNVRAFWRQKKASMAAHATQAAGGDSQRTLAFCIRLPGLLYRLVFGTEWFIERGGSLPRPSSSNSRSASAASSASSSASGAGRARSSSDIFAALR
jgi:LmbE family N-acetylglucosaminyl deacetylase